ncbi:hypothetical protein AB0M02_23085 [Actinoplanes sp. NPDC051861]|uniref:hypothetical protein n=1 Tax=Actinoplanes sp. NPDC051861 TaxID=3155170 RepID=UPI00341F7733
MPKRAAAVPLLVLSFVAGCTSSSPPPPAPSSSPVETTLASLGKRVKWDKLLTPCGRGELVVVQDVAIADVTTDGTPDAVVARACEGDTEYSPSTVEVFDGGSPAAKPRRLGTLLDDAGNDKPYVSGVSWSGGAVLIKANGVDESSDATCPEVVFTYSYRYSAGAFQQDSREVRPDDTCGPS